MKTLNENLFKNKTYAEILNRLDFCAHLKPLEQKFKTKKIIVYGAGILFDFIVDNYDLSKLNLVAVADKRFETNPVETYKGYKAISPNQLQAEKADLILIANTYPVKIKQHLEKTYKKLPPIYFWLNKSIWLYVEEIFD